MEGESGKKEEVREGIINQGIIILPTKNNNNIPNNKGLMGTSNKNAKIISHAACAFYSSSSSSSSSSTTTMPLSSHAFIVGIYFRNM